MTAQRRPRIGVDFHVFDGKFQGTRSHLLGLYSQLVHMCPDIDFYFFLEKIDELKAVPGFNADNVTCVFMPHANPFIRLGLHLPRLRKHWQLDLIHTQYVIPLLPAKGNAVTIHDILFEPFPQFFGKFFVLRSRTMMRFSAHRADLIFTVSEYSKQELITRYKVAPERIAVVLNAVDSNTFFPGRAGEELLGRRGLTSGNYLLTVGRIEPRKNHAGLIIAYGQLPGDQPPLVIVGQRDFGYGEFEHAIAALPANRRVLILSDVQDNELPVLYRHAMLFVYPSFAEGFGMPPLEAMASGTPVITTQSTALPEVVGDAGVLVEPKNVEQLTQALAQLIDSQQLRDHFKHKGLERAQLFSWQNSAQIMAGQFRAFLDN